MPAATETFELPVSLRITGSLERVFGAWLDPRIAREWLCDRMEGEWAAGKAVEWWFGEYRQEIRIIAVEANKRLVFKWNAYGTRPETMVEIEFLQLDGEVGLKLRESSYPLVKEDVLAALDAACGWENLFCRLKAWIEAGVRLR
jgi:uncharacterized protein YndB with AHSA1/START domain